MEIPLVGKVLKLDDTITAMMSPERPTFSWSFDARRRLFLKRRSGTNVVQESRATAQIGRQITKAT